MVSRLMPWVVFITVCSAGTLLPSTASAAQDDSSAEDEGDDAESDDADEAEDARAEDDEAEDRDKRRKKKGTKEKRRGNKEKAKRKQMLPAAEYHSLIGLGLRPLTDEESEELGRPNGLMVDRVKRGSPAGDARLREGDIIIACAGKPARSPSTVFDAIIAATGGDTVKVSVVRDGRDKALSLEAPLDDDERREKSDQEEQERKQQEERERKEKERKEQEEKERREQEEREQEERERKEQQERESSDDEAEGDGRNDRSDDTSSKKDGDGGDDVQVASVEEDDDYFGWLGCCCCSAACPPAAPILTVVMIFVDAGDTTRNDPKELPAPAAADEQRSQVAMRY